MNSKNYIVSLLLFAGTYGFTVVQGQNAASTMMPRTAFQKRGDFKAGFYGKQASGNGSESLQPLPYRRVAVDPTRILLGSVVFVPQAYGVTLPSGEIHDGFFFAHEARRGAGDSLLFYVGEETRNENAFTRSAKFSRAPSCEAYLVSEPVSGALRHRYRDAFELKPKPPLHTMLAKDIDVLVRETGAKEKNFLARLAAYSERAKGTPYKLFCLGEGPTAKYDRDPLVDFSRADCVTFIEQMLALALSSNYDEMFANLLRIRYKDGAIGFTTRNHYTHADWIPNNAWLLHEATDEVGGALCEDMTKVIDRPGFFRKLGVPENELPDVQAPQTMTIKYVPTAHLHKIKDNLQSGDMVSIVQKMPGIFSAHTGFIIRDEYGNVLLRHASSRKETYQVTDEFFDDVIEQLRASTSRVGMAFIRINANLK